MRFERYSSGFVAGTILCSIAFERTVSCREVGAATSGVARVSAMTTRALSVNGEAHSNGSVVMISELEGGEGRALISNSSAEIDFANGVLGGSF